MHPPKPSPCGPIMMPIVGNRWDRCRYLKPMCICSGNENLGNSQWWNVTVICSCAVLGAVFVLFVHSDFSYCSSWLTIQNISIIMNNYLLLTILSVSGRKRNTTDTDTVRRVQSGRCNGPPTMWSIQQICGPGPRKSTELWVWQYGLAFHPPPFQLKKNIGIASRSNSLSCEGPSILMSLHLSQQF